MYIHSFPDGNGRAYRLFMEDHLIRQGYSPVVIQHLEREDYLHMVKDAQDGEPDELAESHHHLVGSDAEIQNAGDGVVE